MKNFTLIVFILISNVLFSQSVSVSGSWTRTTSASDITEAGNDYVGTYTSSTTQTRITISNGSKDKTRVEVRKENNFSDWHPNLILQIKCTNRIKVDSGGNNFQTITDNDAFFLTTKAGNQTNIPLQYTISGISVLLPVKDYTTTIWFTVYDD
jgi:hypothetical protein